MTSLFASPLIGPLLALAAVLAALYWVRFCYRPASWPKTVVKTGAVLPLALAAWLAGGPSALVLALLLCALGDYLLSRPSETEFMAGVGAFAAGHIAYVVLFLTHPTADPAQVFTSGHALYISALVLLGAVMMRVLWSRAGDLRVPVMIYVPVILSMGVSVLALPSLGSLALALPAALLFILSDFTLAFEMFILGEGHRLRRFTPFIVWPAYWGAQLLFLLAFTVNPLT